ECGCRSRKQDVVHGWRSAVIEALRRRPGATIEVHRALDNEARVGRKGIPWEAGDGPELKRALAGPLENAGERQDRGGGGQCGPFPRQLEKVASIHWIHDSVS